MCEAVEEAGPRERPQEGEPQEGEPQEEEPQEVEVSHRNNCLCSICYPLTTLSPFCGRLMEFLQLKLEQKT